MYSVLEAYRTGVDGETMNHTWYRFGSWACALVWFVRLRWRYIFMNLILPNPLTSTTTTTTRREGERRERELEKDTKYGVRKCTINSIWHLIFCICFVRRCRLLSIFDCIRCITWYGRMADDRCRCSSPSTSSSSLSTNQSATWDINGVSEESRCAWKG